MNCLDSTFLIDFLDSERDRHADARDWMAAHDGEPMYAPTFTVWEVLRGAARLDGVTGVDDVLVDLEWLSPLPLTVAAASEAAKIEAELRGDGDEINTADYPIAGTARNAGATLVTADPDFDRIDGLDVEFYGGGD